MNEILEQLKKIELGMAKARLEFLLKLKRKIKYKTLNLFTLYRN